MTLKLVQRLSRRLSVVGPPEGNGSMQWCGFRVVTTRLIGDVNYDRTGSVSSSVVIEPSVMGSSGSEELSSCPIQPERGMSKNSATLRSPLSLMSSCGKRDRFDLYISVIEYAA